MEKVVVGFLLFVLAGAAKGLPVDAADVSEGEQIVIEETRMFLCFAVTRHILTIGDFKETKGMRPGDVIVYLPAQTADVGPRREKIREVLSDETLVTTGGVVINAQDITEHRQRVPRHVRRNK